MLSSCGFLDVKKYNRTYENIEEKWTYSVEEVVKNDYVVTYNSRTPNMVIRTYFGRSYGTKQLIDNVKKIVLFTY